MKVPNVVINTVLKLIDAPNSVTPKERDLTRQWAIDGLAKRAAMAATVSTNVAD